jgi:hypothetical protein
MLIKDPPNLPATAQNPSAVDDGFVVAGRVRPLEVNLLYPLDLDDDRCLLARYRIKTVYGESVREKRGRSHSVRPLGEMPPPRIPAYSFGSPFATATAHDR